MSSASLRRRRESNSSSGDSNAAPPASDGEAGESARAVAGWMTSTRTQSQDGVRCSVMLPFLQSIWASNCRRRGWVRRVRVPSPSQCLAFNSNRYDKRVISMGLACHGVNASSRLKCVCGPKLPVGHHLRFARPPPVLHSPPRVHSPVLHGSTHRDGEPRRSSATAIMNHRVNRRTFVVASGSAVLLAPPLVALAQSPQLLTRRAAKPVVVASANGNKSTDAAGLTCVAKAFQLITANADVLDAVIAGVNILELDPEETSVGYGGLPNADGVVQLDASVMHGPLNRAGAVGCLEGVRTPSRVAKKVMEETDHHLLVGRDAQHFAGDQGFRIEDDLNTEKSRKLWLEWKRRTDPAHYLDPKKRAEAARRAGLGLVAEGLIEPDHFYGTINCNAVNV